MGDFNAIVGHSEQMGCKAIDPRALEEFNDFILNCRLEDAGYKGLSFSWTNGRVAKRLNRVLLNQGYGELFPIVRVTQLAKTLSDHAALLLESCRPKESPRAEYEKSALQADREALHKAKAKHLRALAMEEHYLSQLSGYKWMQEGDKNTSFYHNYVRKKRAILSIYEEGEWISEASQIATSGVNFFQIQFSASPNMDHVELID
ncbi:hypothetical protein LIER_22895 [Lithospermum erythrorhizon]|uniref:Uncharacterized protein n=1 Tax=Lithospermum erythrorhizon TaxID=34254 RepID=A0AAV3QYV9_LITER